MILHQKKFSYDLQILQTSTLTNSDLNSVRADSPLLDSSTVHPDLKQASTFLPKPKKENLLISVTLENNFLSTIV